jgi:hypothetical protein
MCAALLASLVENPQLQEEPLDGWTAASPLCDGPQTASNAWTGIECADPLNKRGVVGKM